MRVYSNNGVMYFMISPQEKVFISKDFMVNKKFIKTTQLGELWGYNYEIPSLLTAGALYFGVAAKRDFYSNKKEEIFIELDLIEREEGVFSFALAPFRVLADYIINGNELISPSLIQLGDLIENQRIKQMSGGYDININDANFRGLYGF